MKRLFVLNKIEFIKHYNAFTIIVIGLYLMYAIGFSLVKLHYKAPVENYQLFESIINRYFRTILFSIMPLTIIVNTSREFSIGYTSKLLSNGYTRRTYFFSKLVLLLQLSVCLLLLQCLIICICYLLNETKFDLVLKDFLITIAAGLITSFYITLFALMSVFLFKTLRDSLAAFFLYQLFEVTLIELFKEKAIMHYLPVASISSLFDYKDAMPPLNLLFILVYMFVFLVVSYRFFLRSEL